MKIIGLVVTLVLGGLCLGLGSCKTVAAAQSGQRTPDCGRAEKVMLLLEQGNAKAIDDAFKLMSCYDGSYADRVDVALGDLITSYPEKIFSAMHTYHCNKDIISGIVNTQPWKLVDKPCKFAVELNRRLKAIDKVKDYTWETNLAKDSLKTFLPVVSANCRENSKGYTDG